MMRPFHRFPEVVALIPLLFSVASAQTTVDARALLKEIASSSRSAKSWRAEGIQLMEMTGRGMQIHDESRFKVAYESPSKMLWETTTTKETIGGADRSFPSGTRVVCDGADHWTLNSPGNSFYHSSVAVSACKPEMGDFSKLADNLLSATVIGRDQVQFASALRECELVRAEYSTAGDNSATARFIRTLCIDPVQKLILRDHIERGNGSDLLSVETTTYISYEQDTSLPADLFEFQVPTGYFEDDGPQPDLIVENGVYRPSMQISAPTLISKIEPVYTAEAIQAGISGIVLVSLQVDSNGNPDKVRVVRGLGYGLDEKAAEAVRQWHFRPGAKDGVPVTVGPLKVAVSFHRP